MIDVLNAFIHIEKAAGTSLIHLLRRNFFLKYADVRPLSKGFIANNGLPVVTGADLAIYKRMNPMLACIGGHGVVPFSDLEFFASKIKYFTVLRDPVDRYLSQYAYRKKRLGIDDNFERYLDIEMLHNLQSKKLGNTGNYIDALKIVEEKCILFGFADEFKKYLIELGDYLSPYINNISYDRVNEGQANMYMSIKEKYIDRIVLANNEDIKLYTELKRRAALRSTGQCVNANKREMQCQSRSLIADKVDWVLRNFYYNPITGLIRVKNGLSYQGVQP